MTGRHKILWKWFGAADGTPLSASWTMIATQRIFASRSCALMPRDPTGKQIFPEKQDHVQKHRTTESDQKPHCFIRFPSSPDFKEPNKWMACAWHNNQNQKEQKGHHLAELKLGMDYGVVKIFFPFRTPQFIFRCSTLIIFTKYSRLDSLFQEKQIALRIPIDKKESFFSNCILMRKP